MVVVGVIGYAAAGDNFASSRLDSARNTYNAVVSHQNAITDEFNAINGEVTAANVANATTAQLMQNRSAYVQLVTQSQAAEPALVSDDAALAAAQASLEDSRWLTILSRPRLDQLSAKIGHERHALATAKTLGQDLVQLGIFFQAYDDALIDQDTLSTIRASDLAGAGSAVMSLKTDVATAIQLSNAPGLPREMQQLLLDLQSLAVDYQKLLKDVAAGDTTAIQADASQGNADAAKVASYDMDKINTEIKSFYQPLIDMFNSEIAKANSM